MNTQTPARSTVSSRVLNGPAIALALVLLALAASPTFAQQPDKRDIKFSADQVDYDDAKKRIRMVGDVIITSEGAKLSAPYAEYRTEKQTAEFQGGVKLVGKESTATGREMKVWYGESRGYLKGGVRLVSQAAAGGSTEEPTVVLCESLDYNWKTEEGLAKGGVKVRQGQNRAFCDRAEIYQKRNEILMVGNVRIEQGQGDWVTAQRAIYDTERQTIRAEGRVVAKTRLQQKEQPDKGPAANPVAERNLPKPTLAEPRYELIPMRRLPVVPLPWLKDPTK